MQLTEREIELLADIPSRQRNRKLGAWAALVFAVTMFIAAPHLGVEYESLGSVAVAILAYTVAEITKAHFRDTSEDKLIALLQRYVSRDPEALRQLYKHAWPGRDAG